MPWRGLRLRPPELLAEHHDLGGFQCRSAKQTDWLRRCARQSAGTGTTKVLGVTGHHSDLVVAYYACCMAQITVADASPRIRKGAGRYPQPVTLLARLGVHTGHEGRDLVAGLGQDVFTRLVALSSGSDAETFSCTPDPGKLGTSTSTSTRSSSPAPPTLRT